MLSIPSSPRWVKAVIGVALFAFVLLSYHRDEVKRYIHESPLAPGAADLNRDDDSFMTVAEATDRCKTQKWQVYPERKRRRRIYDLFIINTEMDWLEIRLNELKDEVDFFVILESSSTFTGLPKPLHLKANWNNFSAFHDQIIYQVLNDTGFVAGSAWDREAFQRNAMFNQVFPTLSDNQKASPGDVILVSDIDEIPRPETLQLLRNCQYPRRLTLRSRFYYYSYEWLHRGDDWQHPQATFYDGNNTIKPEDLRMGHNIADTNEARLEVVDFWNASWHCSSCYATLEEMLNKLASFSHTNWNTPEFRDPERIVRVVRNGLDLYDNEGEFYDRIDSNPDIPGYVASHKDKFAYMVNRDAPNANFQDYTVKEGRSHEAVAMLLNT